MLAVEGVTLMEESVTPEELTVSEALPETEPSVAVMVEVPAATPVARPEVATVAIEVELEVQVTDEVMVCVEPSEYVPVATNCCLAPEEMMAVRGVTAMETRVAVEERTVTSAVAVRPFSVAVMVDVPEATPVTRPATETEATDVLLEDHVARAETSLVAPS